MAVVVVAAAAAADIAAVTTAACSCWLTVRRKKGCYFFFHGTNIFAQDDEGPFLRAVEKRDWGPFPHVEKRAITFRVI